MIDMVMDTLIAQAPGTVAVLVVTVYFLRHLRQSEKMRNHTLKAIDDDCHAMQGRAVVALERNTEMLGRCLQVLEDVDTMLRRQIVQR